MFVMKWNEMKWQTPPWIFTLFRRMYLQALASWEAYWPMKWGTILGCCTIRRRAHVTTRVERVSCTRKRRKFHNIWIFLGFVFEILGTETISEIYWKTIDYYNIHFCTPHSCDPTCSDFNSAIDGMNELVCLKKSTIENWHMTVLLTCFNPYRGVFRGGGIGPWPSLAKKSFFTIGKNWKTWFVPFV